MTRDEFTALASSLARHGMTAGAGLLAANGLIVPGDALTSAIPAVAMAAAAMAWSWIEKSHVLARLAADAPSSDLEDLFRELASMRSKGANPILIANIAQSAVAVATHEAVTAHPELIQQAQAQPASTVQPASTISASPEAVVPPSVQSPENLPSDVQRRVQEAEAQQKAAAETAYRQQIAQGQPPAAQNLHPADRAMTTIAADISSPFQLTPQVQQ